MRAWYPLVVFMLIGIFMIGTPACYRQDVEFPSDRETPTIEKLVQHQQRFSPRVERVGNRVYSAIGYGLANSIMVVVEGGKVIVDTSEGVDVARTIKAQFDRIEPGPVKAIIYTHTHADHILGASVFHAPGIPIWATDAALPGMDEQFASLGDTIRRRAARQFGEALDPGVRISNGIGPFLRLDDGPVPPLLYPTETFSKKAGFTIGGVDFKLIEAHGETHDQLFVWLPAEKTLLPGDNIYAAFPNLYSTRGVPPRPVKDWIRSLEAMRALEPEYLVPSHTEPLIGKAVIRQTLTAYRDGIAFVHDSVIRMANAGYAPDDIARRIVLPPHLRDHPYLQEFYGTVPWSARGIYDGYLGWFDGNPTNLVRLHPRERAGRLLPLLGGREKVLTEIHQALEGKDMAWAAELSDHLLAVDPKDREARGAKARAIEWIGRRQANPNARCYLLTSARELSGRYDGPDKPKITFDTIRAVPLRVILSTLPERLDPIITADVDMVVGFRFLDSGTHYTLHIRRGVGEVQEAEANEADLQFTATEEDFKKLIAGGISPAVAVGTGRVKISGGLKNLLAFQSYLIDL